MRQSIAVCTSNIFASRTGLFHGDIGPHNFVKVKNTVKLVDRGTSTRTDSDNSFGGHVRVFHCTPPEVLAGRQYNTKSDVYSMGIMYAVFSAGELPFNADDGEIMFA